jgi:hypothetical protein
MIGPFPYRAKRERVPEIFWPHERGSLAGRRCVLCSGGGARRFLQEDDGIDRHEQLPFLLRCHWRNPNNPVPLSLFRLRSAGGDPHGRGVALPGQIYNPVMARLAGRALFSWSAAKLDRPTKPKTGARSAIPPSYAPGATGSRWTLLPRMENRLWRPELCHPGWIGGLSLAGQQPLGPDEIR